MGEKMKNKCKAMKVLVNVFSHASVLGMLWLHVCECVCVNMCTCVHVYEHLHFCFYY